MATKNVHAGSFPSCVIDVLREMSTITLAQLIRPILTRGERVPSPQHRNMLSLIVQIHMERRSRQTTRNLVIVFDYVLRTVRGEFLEAGET